MKLGLPLLAVAVSAQGIDDIDPFLAELNAYCKATYGLPAYRPHRSDTRQQWKQRWDTKKGFESVTANFLKKLLRFPFRVSTFRIKNLE